MRTEDFDDDRPRWIAVAVSIFGHPLFGGAYSRRDAWLWLVANAAWKDHRVRTRGGVIEIKRGEVIAGLRFLAETWGWSAKRVRTFLGELADEGMISRGQTKNQYAAIVTICNYEKYQTAPEAGASERQAKGKRRASEGQHSTKDTRDTEDKKDYARARLSSEATTFDLGARREVAGLSKEEPGARVSLDNGRLVLGEELRTYWLPRFGDEEGLDLALTQAAAYVQPCGLRPLETQVSSQLARMSREKRDRDRRYERAAAIRSPPGRAPPQSMSDVLKRLRGRDEPAR